MRRVLALVLVAVVLALASAPPPALAKEPESISRDARGPQPYREHDPLGGPVTPTLYLLGQTTIFTIGVSLLVIAALLGAYTMLLTRRAPPRR
jgi:hypothetical protein